MATTKDDSQAYLKSLVMAYEHTYCALNTQYTITEENQVTYSAPKKTK